MRRLDEIEARAGRYGMRTYELDADALMYDDVPAMVAALRAVLGVFPDATDPCPPRTCTHVDCEVVNAVTEALEGKKP